MSSGNPDCELPVSELLQVKQVVFAHTERLTQLQHLLPLPLIDEQTRAPAPAPETLPSSSRVLPSQTAGQRAPTRFFPTLLFPAANQDSASDM